MHNICRDVQHSFSGLNVKMTCITQVSFKITIRKRHVYIDFRWPWKWNQYFDLGIWYDKRTKIIFLLSFQLVTRLKLQNRNETILLMNSDTNCSFKICMFVAKTSGKFEIHTYFTFLQRILTSTHIWKFNIFLHNICHDVQHSFSGLNVKMTCITQVSFKITIRKRHVYIDIRWPWKWNQYFYLAIWEDERSKIIFLLLFSSLHD